jgi:FAD/FMN-containing dehydrogenase
MSAQANVPDREPQRRLHEVPALLAEASSDFGGLVRATPAVVARPRNAGDVQRVVSAARARGLGVVARGQGHSTRGQASVAGGLVVDMRAIERCEIAGSVAVVGAGLRWDELLRQTLKRGLTPPVLTDYVGLSVGGTLAVGGVGGQSFRHGLQVDQLEGLRVVTGSGTIVDCSRTTEPELFDACRGGLGQCAIVVEAHVRLVRAPISVRVFKLFYDDLGRWLSDQKTLADDGRFDYILGSVIVRAHGGLSFCLETAKYQYWDESPRGDLFDGLGCDPADSELRGAVFSYLAYATRLSALERQMKADRSWYACHPWIDLFVPWTTASEVIATSLADMDPRWLRNSHTLTYPVSRPHDAAPLTGLSPSEPHLLFGIGPTFDHSDVQGLAGFEASSARLFERAQALGARCYPIGFPVGTEHADWPRHFGRSWARLAELKRHYDPFCVLRAGSVFATGGHSDARGSGAS